MSTLNTRYVIKIHVRSPDGKLVVPLWHGCHNLLYALAMASFLEKQDGVRSVEAFTYERSGSVKPQNVTMKPVTNAWIGLVTRSFKNSLAVPSEKDLAWTSDTRYCHGVILPVPSLNDGKELGCLEFHTQHTNSEKSAAAYVETLFQSRVIAAYRPLHTATQYVLHGSWTVGGRGVTTNPNLSPQSLVEVIYED